MAETPDTADRHPEGVEMPQPTAAPLVLALGLAVLLAGWATSLVFVIVGAGILVAGLGSWISHLLPGRGQEIEPLAVAGRRALPVEARIGAVGQLRAGMPGYRLRLPEKVRPISAGFKGGIVGGIVMPLPAMLYGVLSGHGIWYPVNLLAGMVLPGVEQLSVEELEHFNPTLLTVAIAIHATISIALGVLYGVLLPTLPSIPRPLAWGALLMPLLWTAASFIATGIVDPTVRELIDWPYFVLSQFVFGIAAALAVILIDEERPVFAGLIGGVVGGVLMTAPALLWGYFSGHGIWYPANLLAVMMSPHSEPLSMQAIEQYNPNWLAIGIVVHAAFSIAFGLLYGLSLRKVPRIPGPFAWGAMMMPLLWTATSYAMMGIVNPVLQQRVDWPWFVVSQFVYGLAAALVVVRAEEMPVAPAGRKVRPEP